MWAASERCADLLYATGIMTPDPFLWMDVPGETLVVLSPLEISRGRKCAKPGLRVDTIADVAERLGLPANPAPKTEELVPKLAESHGISRWRVPASFPFGLSEKLREAGLTLEPADTFFPQRARKTDDEVAHIREGVRLAETGLARGIAVLREATVGNDGVLQWGGDILTAEVLRGEIDAKIARCGGTASHTITAPGPQGADPHESGAGPIRAHEPIVLDIFPRVDRTGYCGDLTRTVVKGAAPDIVHRAFEAVDAARRAAKRAVKARVPGKTVHEAAVQTLKDAGFETDAKAETPYGFFHGTGHGLGLEVHEAPRVNAADAVLEAGNVITIEPGLYYPEWGGVRIEDVVVVTDAGHEDLTTADVRLEVW